MNQNLFLALKMFNQAPVFARPPHQVPDTGGPAREYCQGRAVAQRAVGLSPSQAGSEGHMEPACE